MSTKSRHIAMALRPFDNPTSMVSRYGSQALADGLRPAGVANSAPKSVVTSLAGFAGGCRPHPPGGRKAMPAAFKYAAAVPAELTWFAGFAAATSPIALRRELVVSSLRSRRYSHRPRVMAFGPESRPELWFSLAGFG